MTAQHATARPDSLASLLVRASALGLTARPALETDRAFLAEVYASTRAEEIAVVDWSAEEKAAFLQMQFDAQDHHYRAHYGDAERLVLMHGGKRIGRLYAERWPSEIRVIDIALLPSWRGMGLGAAVMRDVMAAASAEGRGVGIHVESFNPAMRLYERLGFTPAGEKGVYLLMRWQPGETSAE